MAMNNVQQSIKKSEQLLEASFSQNLQQMKKTVEELKALSDAHQNTQLHLNYARGLTNVLKNQGYLDGKPIINELSRLRDASAQLKDFQTANMIDQVLGKLIIMCKAAESKRQK